MREKNIEES